MHVDKGVRQPQRKAYESFQFEEQDLSFDLARRVLDMKNKLGQRATSRDLIKEHRSKSELRPSAQSAHNGSSPARGVASLAKG